MYGQDNILQSQAAGASIQHASRMTSGKFTCATVSPSVQSERSSTSCQGLFFRLSELLDVNHSEKCLTHRKGQVCFIIVTSCVGGDERACPLSCALY